MTIMSMIVSMCGGDTESTPVPEETTTTSTTTTFAPSKVEVFDETDLVVPPILLKPLIGATGILTSTSEDWEVLTEIVSLDMGVKVRTADNGTAQMTFEDGSSLLMGGNSVVNIRSFNYDEEAGARVLTVDVISGSIAYDIFSEGLNASLAKIVTPTAELSVHGTEGVFAYDVSTFSATSTVLEGGEESDDAVFSELLPDNDGNPVLVAVSQTAGTELGSGTTGGSGWIEEDSSSVALIVDEFVSNMEGVCSYTCKVETQENLADGTKDLTADVAANAVFTEGDTNRMELAQTLLVAAGAPGDITESVQVLTEAVAEIAVPEEVVQEFINANWQEAPVDGIAQELPPMTEFIDTFSEAASVHENDALQGLGFDHNENGGFRALHGMMQFISADTNAVNELAETGDVASAMALAAANMFVNAGQDEFAEGTFCADNPNDTECAAGSPPPEFLAQAFAGNHFVEDMVQGMGFEYTFTENNIKPEYCTEQTWLPECANGPEFVGDAFEEGGAYCEANPDGCIEGGPEAGKMFFGGEPEKDSFCADSPDSPECMGGNAQAVYTFFHVYDENVLGNDWEPVDCGLYPDDPMCSGDGDFFHEHVGDATGLALDRNDMFDIYGGPQQLTGPPPEFCQENPDAVECGENYKASDIFSEGEYIAPAYCGQNSDAPECDTEFGQSNGLQSPLTGALLAQYAAPEPNAQSGEKPQFCIQDPNHPECFRDYYGEGSLDTGEFLGNMFSDDSFVDLTQQGVFYNAIEGADDLASQRYGNHNDYLVINCDDAINVSQPECQPNFNPTETGLFSGGGEDIVEFEAFSPEDVDTLCVDNPQDPLCFTQQNVPGDAFGTPPEGSVIPGTPPNPGGFWGDAEKAEEFQNQTDNFVEFAGEYCDENPADPTCSQVSPPGGEGTPPGGDMSPPDGEEVPGGGDMPPPPDGEEVPGGGDMPPPPDGEEQVPGGEGTPPGGDMSPPDGEEPAPPPGGEQVPGDGEEPAPPPGGEQVPGGGEEPAPPPGGEEVPGGGEEPAPPPGGEQVPGGGEEPPPAPAPAPAPEPGPAP